MTASAPTGQLTATPSANRVAVDRQAESEPQVDTTPISGPATPDREPVPPCRPFVYEEISADDGEESRPPARAVARGCREPVVDLVREGGVVREVIVDCSCGRTTRLRIDYDEGGAG